MFRSFRYFLLSGLFRAKYKADNSVVLLVRWLLWFINSKNSKQGKIGGRHHYNVERLSHGPQSSAGHLIFVFFYFLLKERYFFYSLSRSLTMDFYI